MTKCNYQVIVIDQANLFSVLFGMRFFIVLYTQVVQATNFDVQWVFVCAIASTATALQNARMVVMNPQIATVSLFIFSHNFLRYFLFSISIRGNSSRMLLMRKIYLMFVNSNIAVCAKRYPILFCSEMYEN